MTSVLHLDELLAQLGVRSAKSDSVRAFLARLEDHHRAGGSRNSLARLGEQAPTRLDQSRWQGWLQAYQRFWGRRQLQPFSPLNGRLVWEGRTLLLEPDLGLEVDGVPYSLFVHLGADSLVGEPSQLICQAFSEGLDLDGGVRVAVLDLPRNQWLSPSVPGAALAERLRDVWSLAVS